MVVQARGSPNARSANDSFDEDSLCALARAVPKVKKTGNASADSQAALVRQSMQRIIERLTNCPDEVIPCWAYLSTGGAISQPAASKMEWDRTVATVGRLPKYWLAQFITENDASAQKFSRKLLDLVDSEDVAGIRKIFYMATQTSAATPLPMLARQSKALCGKLFLARLLQVNNPLQGLAAKLVNFENGKLKWLTGGPYSIKFVEGKATTITYLNGDNVDVAAQCVLTQDFEIRDPWDAWSAIAIKGIQRYPLHELFKSENNGPYAFKLDRKGLILEQLATVCHSKMEELRVEQAKGIVAEEEVSFVGEARKEKQRQVLQAAQAKAAAKSKRARVVKLTT